MSLPPPTENPCNDCPWRRNAVPGWLGPYEAEDWRVLAHSDEPIACHMTIPSYDDYAEDFTEEEWADVVWEHPALRQCRGAAIYRANVGKSPRNRDVTVGPRDTANVFATPSEFLEYHGGRW